LKTEAQYLRITDSLKHSRLIKTALPAIICTLLWGVGYPVVKLSYPAFGIESADVPSKLLFAGIRFSLAGLMTLVYTHAVRCRTADSNRPLMPKGSLPIKGILMLALFQTVLQYAFTYIGLANTTGAKSSVLNQANVFLLVITAPLFFRNEKLTLTKLFGCIVGFLGIVIVNFNGSELMLSIGDIFILLASVSAAAGYLISKYLNGTCSPEIMTGCQQLTGGVILLAAGVISGGRFGIITPAGIGYLLFLSFAASCSYTLWVKLLHCNEVSSISVYKFMTPIFGVFFSGILLGESILSFKNLLSLILVCIGIYAVNRKSRNTL